MIYSKETLKSLIANPKAQSIYNSGCELCGNEWNRHVAGYIIDDFEKSLTSDEVQYTLGDFGFLTMIHMGLFRRADQMITVMLEDLGDWPIYQHHLENLQMVIIQSDDNSDDDIDKYYRWYVNPQITKCVTAKSAAIASATFFGTDATCSDMGCIYKAVIPLKDIHLVQLDIYDLFPFETANDEFKNNIIPRLGDIYVGSFDGSNKLSGTYVKDTGNVASDWRFIHSYKYGTDGVTLKAGTKYFVCCCSKTNSQGNTQLCTYHASCEPYPPENWMYLFNTVYDISEHDGAYMKLDYKVPGTVTRLISDKNEWIWV